MCMCQGSMQRVGGSRISPSPSLSFSLPNSACVDNVDMKYEVERSRLQYVFPLLAITQLCVTM